MTTRRALLVSNPGELGEENYCAGVAVDVKNYQRFLTSAEGGGWFSWQIESMIRPTRSALRSKIAEFSGFDYTLVMFTGHGWYSNIDKDRILNLQKGEEIASIELCQHASKRVVILDCCQAVHNESIKAKFARALAFANEAKLLREPNMDKCRQRYTDKIDGAPGGCMRLFSCAVDERSADDDSLGGRYNSSLIGAAEAWAIDEANKSWAAEASMSLAECHEEAAARTRRASGDTQNPAIEKPKTGPYYPFAVFAS